MWHPSNTTPFECEGAASIDDPADLDRTHAMRPPFLVAGERWFWIAGFAIGPPGALVAPSQVARPGLRSSLRPPCSRP
ncbi:MAG: hypothetical protein EAZ84_05640 [Verrucomicrobia bacterium]|nr:MAG: hypothetical protein EAZ84_05640 [Verrucomicrobiota bacterium]TAE86958.1 MAG: hypothetical protein EAZ82_09420 [Verrucomicrobiota bacterium]TAF24749.1 MAG: hypothetical protein EAZ71_09645 [Verrucomicrobiota bacterium]